MKGLQASVGRVGRRVGLALSVAPSVEQASSAIFCSCMSHNLPRVHSRGLDHTRTYPAHREGSPSLRNLIFRLSLCPFIRPSAWLFYLHVCSFRRLKRIFVLLSEWMAQMGAGKLLFACAENELKWRHYKSNPGRKEVDRLKGRQRCKTWGRGCAQIRNDKNGRTVIRRTNNEREFRNGGGSQTQSESQLGGVVACQMRLPSSVSHSQPATQPGSR